MDKPSKEIIEAVRAKHPVRSLHLVSLKRPGEGAETFYLVMVGCDADEYKTFTDSVIKAKDSSTTAIDRNEKFEFTVKAAVMRQTAWPDREDVKKILHENPGFLIQLAETLHEHAGATAEVRSEKL